MPGMQGRRQVGNAGGSQLAQQPQRLLKVGKPASVPSTSKQSEAVIAPCRQPRSSRRAVSSGGQPLPGCTAPACQPAVAAPPAAAPACRHGLLEGCLAGPWWLARGRGSELAEG